VDKGEVKMRCPNCRGYMILPGVGYWVTRWGQALPTYHCVDRKCIEERRHVWVLYNDRLWAVRIPPYPHVTRWSIVVKKYESYPIEELQFSP